jgi:hypothetical protein
MMTTSTPVKGRFDEVLVTVGPMRMRRSDLQRSTAEPRRTYETLVYSNLPDIRIGGAAVSDTAPREIGGLQLVGRDEIRIRWSSYEEYLRMFLEGEKAPGMMRSRLLEDTWSGLEAMIGSLANRRIRLWWNNESPELDELPWELIASTITAGQISFARGMPRDYAPIVPIDQTVRVAFIGEPRAGDALRRAMTDVHPEVEVKSLGERGIRDGLRQAVAERFELAHIVADGNVSQGFDGVLELNGERLAPREMRALLFGSRVTVLCLSPAARPSETGGAPSVYRAFAHLGASQEGNVTMVAPIGPMDDSRVEEFWSLFYRALGRTLSVEDALIAAKQQVHAAGSIAPIALFLAHRLGVQFRRRTAKDPAQHADPVRLNVELKASRAFLAKLQRHLEARAAEEAPSKTGNASFMAKVREAAAEGEREGLAWMSKISWFRRTERDLDSLEEALDPWRKPNGGL